MAQLRVMDFRRILALKDLSMVLSFLIVLLRTLLASIADLGSVG